MPAVAVVGAAVVGGMISAQQQSSAAKKAANVSLQNAKNSTELTAAMYNQNREDLAPYRDAGQIALQAMSPDIKQVQLPDGQWANYDDIKAHPEQYFQVGNGNNPGDTRPKTITETVKSHGFDANGQHNQDKQVTRQLSEAERTQLYGPAPVNSQNKSYQNVDQWIQGQGLQTQTVANPNYVSPTKGLSQFQNELAGTQQNINRLDEISQQMGNFDFKATDKYMKQIEGLDFNFQFDPNDPIYQWRQSENTRTVNQFQASRGGYDSRAAANMLLSSGMQLQSEEVNNQYSRYVDKYNASMNQLNSLANMAATKETKQYNQLGDLYRSNVDQLNAKTSKAITGFNQQLTSNNAEQARLNALATLGMSAAGQTAAAGQSTAVQQVGINQLNSQNQQNAILQQGAANAQLANTIGQIPANYMAAQYYTQK